MCSVVRVASKLSTADCSVPVRPPAWQHARHHDRTRHGIEAEANAPVAHSQAPLVSSASKPSDVAPRRIFGEVVKSVQDAATYLIIESAQIVLGRTGERPAPRTHGLTGSSPRSRRRASSAVMESPRWYAVQA